MFDETHFKTEYKYLIKCVFNENFIFRLTA